MGRVEVREPPRRRRADLDGATKGNARMHAKAQHIARERFSQRGEGPNGRRSPKVGQQQRDGRDPPLSVAVGRGGGQREGPPLSTTDGPRFGKPPQHRRVTMVRDKKTGVMMRSSPPIKLSPAEQLASNSAEAAAKTLLTELQSIGYDPQNGGELLKLGSLESSGSTVATDRYQTSPSTENEDNKYDAMDDRAAFGIDRRYNGTPHPRDRDAVEMSRDESTEDSRTSCTSRTNNDDWTRFTRDTKSYPSSRETNTHASDLVTMFRSSDTDDNYVDGRTYADDNDSRTEYTDWTKDVQERQEMEKKIRNVQARSSAYEQPQQKQQYYHHPHHQQQQQRRKGGKTSPPPPKLDDTSGSSSDISDREFRNAVTDSFEISYSSETFRNVVGHERNRPTHKSGGRRGDVKHDNMLSPVIERKPQYIGGPPSPSPPPPPLPPRQGNAAVRAAPRRRHPFPPPPPPPPPPSPPKQNEPISPTDSAATDLRRNMTGSSTGSQSSRNRRIPDGRRSPPLAADMAGRISPREQKQHFFPTEKDEQCEEKNRTEGKAKPSPRTKPFYKLQDKLLDPISEGSTERTPHSSTRGNSSSTQFGYTKSRNAYYCTSRSLLDDATLLSAAESSLLSSSVQSSTIAVKDDAPSKASGSMKNKIIRLLPGPPKFSSHRQHKEGERLSRIHEVSTKPTVGLVSREKLFADLQKEGINPEKHQVGRWKQRGAGSVIGKVVDPLGKKETPLVSVGDLTNDGDDEWSIVSRESDCVSESEFYPEVTNAEITSSSPKQEEKKNRFKKFKGFVRKLQNSPRHKTKMWEVESRSSAGEEEMKLHFSEHMVSSTRASAGSSARPTLEGSTKASSIQRNTFSSTKAYQGSGMSGMNASPHRDEASLAIEPPSLVPSENTNAETKASTTEPSKPWQNPEVPIQNLKRSLSPSRLAGTIRRMASKKQDRKEEEPEASDVDDSRADDDIKRKKGNVGSTSKKARSWLVKKAFNLSSGLRKGKDNFDYSEADSKVISGTAQGGRSSGSEDSENLVESSNSGDDLQGRPREESQKALAGPRDEGDSANENDDRENQTEQARDDSPAEKDLKVCDAPSAASNKSISCADSIVESAASKKSVGTFSCGDSNEENKKSACADSNATSKNSVGSFSCTDADSIAASAASSISDVSASIASKKKTADADSIASNLSIEVTSTQKANENRTQEKQESLKAVSKSTVELPLPLPRIDSGETGRSSGNADSAAAIATERQPELREESDPPMLPGRSEPVLPVQLTTRQTNPFACGQIGFVYPDPRCQSQPKKSVRFSEDLALVHQLPPDPESITLSGSIDSRQSLDSLSRRKDIDEVHPSAFKKNGVVARFLSRFKVKRIRKKSKKMDSIEEDEDEESYFSSEGSDDEPETWKRQPDTHSKTSRGTRGRSPERRRSRSPLLRDTSPRDSVASSEGGISFSGGSENGAEGIELVARRTKAGKQAVLIAKASKNSKYDIPANASNSPRSADSKLARELMKFRSRSRSKSPVKAKAALTKSKGKSVNNGRRLRLRFFKSTTNKPQTDPVKSENPKIPPIARVQKLNGKDPAFRVSPAQDRRDQEIVRAPRSSAHRSSGGLQRKLQQEKNSLVHDDEHQRNGKLESAKLPRNQLKQVPEEKKKEKIATGRRNDPPLFDIHRLTSSETGETSDEANQNSTSAMSATTASSSSVTFFGGQNLPAAQPAYGTQGSEPYSSPVVDLFSWLMPGVFPPNQTELQGGSAAAPNTSATISRASINGNTNKRPSSDVTPKKFPSSPQSQGRSYADEISSHDTSTEPGKKIPEDRWREILDATETLALKYQEQRAGEDESTLSISDDTINEVNEAIRKFRDHAARLNMNEKELMAHVRDDDRSLQARSVQSLKNGDAIISDAAAYAAAQQYQATGAGNDFVANASNAFLDMYEYYFGIPQTDPGSALTVDSS